MSVSIWQADGSQPRREVDFLVIGAGLVGCTAAYFAAQAGRAVTITEMRDVGLGASSRNAGFMITGLEQYYHQGIDLWGRAKTHELWDLSRRTINYWRQFAKRGGDVQIRDSGSLLLSESPEEAREIELAARAMEADGLPVEFLSADPLHRGFYNSLRQPDDGAVQPYQLVWSIFRQSGAELINNNEVYAIAQPNPAGPVIVATRQAIFEAQYVLVCTNAYSASLDPYFVGKVIPTRAQCIATAPLREPVLDTCGYSNYGYMYYRETFDGRLLIGGARHHHKPLEHDTTDDRITDPVQRSLEQYLRTRFPDVDVPVERRWAGIMGFSVDGIPLVGTIPDKPRVGFAVGFTGHGLSTGAVVAERAVDHLLTGADVGAVAASRLQG